MTENKFLNYVLIEGIILLLLGMCMLILPKVSIISFGLMICLSFVFYGGYKVFSALITKNFSRHFILDIISGIILAITGIFLFIAPVFNIIWIIGLIGIYFILKSISSSAFSVQTRKTLNFWWMFLFLAILEMLLGILIIIMIPSAALWFVGIIAGLDFIITGVILVNMYISTKYMHG